MIRITVISGIYYGIEIDDEISESESENIVQLVNEGIPVIIVNEISDLNDFGIGDDVTMVEQD